MLITSDEAISTAYITKVDVNLIIKEFIVTAEAIYIKPVLTETLYDDVIANPGNYTTLISDYIKPCLAFYIKYLTYSQQLFETAEYSSPDPTRGKELIINTNAVLIRNDVQQNIIKDILFIARKKEKILQDYLIAQAFALYVAPTKQRIGGFLISSE